MPLSHVYRTIGRIIPMARHRLTTARLLYRGIHLARTAVGKSDHLTVRRRGLSWHLNLYEGIDFSIYLMGSFQPDSQALCKSVLHGITGAIVLDIGANVGAFALPLAEIVSSSEGKVYAFEPTRWAFGKLCRNLDANPHLKGMLDPVQAILVDAGDAAVPEHLHASWPLVGDQEQHPVHQGALKDTRGAFSTTLDAFVGEHGISRVDFIKLDVDGNETTVLDGAWDTINTHRPALLIEWTPDLFPDGSLNRAGQKLLDLGYQIYIGQSEKPSATDINTLNSLLPKGSGFDVLFLHHVQKKDK